MNFIVRKVIFPIMVTIISLMAPAYPQTVDEISSELVCQCGCGLVLNNCNHSDCGVAIPMRKLIAEKLANGESKEEILAYFVDRYGEVVLAAPTKKGFNLTAWILPFIGIAIGASVIVIVILLWLKNRKETINIIRDEHEEESVSDEYKKIFEDEIKDFE